MPSIVTLVELKFGATLELFLEAVVVERKVLTFRQAEVLRLHSAGLSADEIGVQLGIRRRTVLRYLAEARHRAGAHNDAHLLRIALETEALLPPARTPRRTA